MVSLTRVASILVIGVSILAILSRFIRLDSPRRIMAASYLEVYDARNDPKLPITLDVGIADVTGRKIPNGAAVLVLCGQCASCSLKTYDADAVAQRLSSRASLILVYQTSPSEIRRQYKNRAVRENEFIIADSSNAITHVLNAGFPYRHALGQVRHGVFLATRLQQNGQSETELTR
jgi:hypothetical protein